jgi:hypothetical protein
VCGELQAIHVDNSSARKNQGSQRWISLASGWMADPHCLFNWQRTIRMTN